MSDNWLANLAGLGFAGFGLGLGLVVGAFAARTLRRYMSDEDMKPYERKRKGDDE